jgi:hypothetical protein
MRTYRSFYLRRLAQEQRGSQTVEYLVATPIAILFLAMVIGQLALAAVGLITCEAAARDAAVAATRGNDPLLAARQAAPDWNVAVSDPEQVQYGSYRGVRVTVSLKIPVLPVRMLAGRSFPIARTVTMPAER